MHNGLHFISRWWQKAFNQN